ncbi:MAG: hydroxyacylglutathione hydrolase [Spirochaetota bacterium]|nr:hydroxyacylglutathione hydrolase [Spirochaetota bacterium]
MVIKQIFTGNSFRNYFYYLVCPDTGNALVVDPIDADMCLSIASTNNWKIVYIVNTHEHGDHTMGNDSVKKATGAKLMAYTKLKNNIPNVDIELNDGDIINLGNSIKLEVIYSPGHTMSHICLLSQHGELALISGDALFNAGAGNCYNGGDPVLLYQTFVERFNNLPGETKIYPGHDYIVNNLMFTLNREPDNDIAKELLQKVKEQDPENPFVSTINIEKDINTFFRLKSPSLIAQLKENIPSLPDNPSPKDVFLQLRALRNNW